MRKYTSVVLALLMAATSYAEQRLTIHGASRETEISVFQMKTIDLHDGSAYFNGRFLQPDTIISVENIDSITFADPIDENYVQLIYEGDSVYVINPYADDGLNVDVKGSDVTVTSNMDGKNVTFYMKGYTLDGSFVITPSKKFNMLLNGLLLSNQDGPAVKILEDKEARVILADGSANIFQGKGVADTNAVVWSNAQIVFTPQLNEDDQKIEGGNQGSGTLTVTSPIDGHGIFSSDYVRIDAGNILMTNVAGDGINSNDYFEMNGGSLLMDSVMGDGIDCNDHIFINGGLVTMNSVADDVKALKCDSMINILGGTQIIMMTGRAAKGLKNDTSDIRIENADLTISLSGDLFGVSSEDRSYCAGIKSEKNVLIDNSNITVVCGENATGAKGINATAGITITNSNVTVSADGLKDEGADSGGKVACLKTDGTLSVENSKVTVSCENEEEKGVKVVDAAEVIGDIDGYVGE